MLNCCSREFSEYKAYNVLDYFKSDWLNEFYDENHEVADDYRFVYMGPKGTWTPFHADVLRSYSWSANICGRKKWIIYPPGEEQNLKDLFGNLPFDVTSGEIEDRKKFPNYKDAPKPIEIIQEEGEIVFMPSCWYHQVHNLEDTISINHNWTNAYGINFMVHHLQGELTLVQKEIAEFEDSEGWNEQCQLILKCTCGINYQELLNMLVALMKPRYHLLRQSLEFRKRNKNTSSEKEGLFKYQNKLLEAFKQLDITCTAKEHLKYGSTVSDEGENPVTEFNSCLLDKRINDVIFDLQKLLTSYNEVSQSLLSTSRIVTECSLISDIGETLKNLV